MEQIMTPEQRLQFCHLLKEARSNNTTITVQEVMDKLGITEDDAKKPWSSDLKISFAFEFDYKWTVYAKENRKD